MSYEDASNQTFNVGDAVLVSACHEACEWGCTTCGHHKALVAAQLGVQGGKGRSALQYTTRFTDNERTFDQGALCAVGPQYLRPAGAPPTPPKMAPGDNYYGVLPIEKPHSVIKKQSAEAKAAKEAAAAAAKEAAAKEAAAKEAAAAETAAREAAAKLEVEAAQRVAAQEKAAQEAANQAKAEAEAAAAIKYAKEFPADGLPPPSPKAQSPPRSPPKTPPKSPP